MKLSLEEAIQRLKLPDLSRKLGIAGEIPDRDGKTVSCFWPDRHANGDRKPSFNFHDNLARFKCFGCGIEGRGPDLVAARLNLSMPEAIAKFISMAGGAPERPHNPPKKRKRLILPKDLFKGTEDDWRAVANLRKLEPGGVSLAVELGILRFGTVKGFPSWIITDEKRIVAEARRMDGEDYPEIGDLGKRKTHTLAGSDKSWPAGILPLHPKPDAFRKILVCEGTPDPLAAFHFLYVTGNLDALPVTILGRTSGGDIHPEALRLFREKRVRIYPHADADGGGRKAAIEWKKQIEEAGASKVDGFDFSGLIRKDGKPVSDLNDCTEIRTEDELELEGLLP